MSHAATSTIPLLALAPVDWAVISVYLLLLIATGVWAGRAKQHSARDYFLGNKSMPVWAVAASVLATALSAATFIGVPELSFKGDLRYLSMNVGLVIAAVIVAVFFIPAFYRIDATSIYEILERRFSTRSRRAASTLFMLGRALASAARVYIGAIPLAMIIVGSEHITPADLLLAIAILAAVGILYTIVGGIASVIWTDVIQAAVFVIAAAAAIIALLYRIPAGPAEITSILAAQHTPAGTTKLTTLSLSTSLADPFTLPSVLIGFTLMGIASYGTDQDMVQRMLTCKSAARGSRSAITGVLIAIPVIALFLLIGLLLHVFYSRPDIMAHAGPSTPLAASAQVFPQFIIHEMPRGLAGLMIAGLFAAGLSSVNSTLNALASTTISDFYRPFRPSLPERHYLHAGRAAVALWGIALAAIAAVCVHWRESSGQTLIDFALSVMTFAYAGLLGAFFTALFTRRGRSWSIIAGLIVGPLVVLALQTPVWAAWTAYLPSAIRPPPSTGLAWTWHLTIATAISTLVCILPPGRPTTPAPPSDDPRRAAASRAT